MSNSLCANQPPAPEHGGDSSDLSIGRDSSDLSIGRDSSDLSIGDGESEDSSAGRNHSVGRGHGSDHASDGRDIDRGNSEGNEVDGNLNGDLHQTFGIATLPGYFDPANPEIVKSRARALGVTLKKSGKARKRGKTGR